MKEKQKKNNRKLKYKNNKHVILIDTQNCQECGKIFEYNYSRGTYREIKYCSNNCRGKAGGKLVVKFLLL